MTGDDADHSDRPDRPMFPIPNQRQLAWQRAEMGVLISYDLHVFDTNRYCQEINRIDPIADHQIFNPQELDTDQWIRAAKSAGAAFAVLTATHETGFALFQSEVNPYCMRALNWRGGKGDIVRDFVESCRKYGVKPGIYLGIRWNSLFGVHDFKMAGEGSSEARFRENRRRWYRRMAEGMVSEICTNYGELFEIWFDGGADHPDNGAPDVLPIVRRYQPDCLFYHNGQLAEVRWGGSETGRVGYPCWATFPYPAIGAGESAPEDIPKDDFRLLKQGDPQGKYWMPAMADAPLRGWGGRHEWFWESGDEKHIYPLKELVDMYCESVGRNSTLVLGLTPDSRGLMPPEDVRRLEELGTELERRFSSPVGEISGAGKLLEITLEENRRINQIVIQEDIAHGERVRRYRIEAAAETGRRTVAEGSSIGHKRIHRLDHTVETRRLRLIIDDSVAEPLISSWSVYCIED